MVRPSRAYSYVAAARPIALVAGIALAAIALTPATGFAETLDQIKAAAAKEGKVVWYDSLPRAQGDAILKEFQKAYPFIKTAEYLEVPGAAKTARITQESRAGGPTADVTLDGPAADMRFQSEGFVEAVDWKALGVEMTPERTPNQYLIAIAAPIYGILYNTNKVKDAEAPKSYEEMADPKWAGRFGTWARAIAFVILSADWGEQKSDAYVKKLEALKPKLYRSTYAAAQSVGAGEVDLAYTIYHTAVPTIEQGAPVKFHFLEPVPVSALYGVLLKHGRNPNAGKLLLKWLGSDEGAIVYEKVSKRGNPFIKTTETAKLLAGKKISMFDPETEVKKSKWYNEKESAYGKWLQGQ
jgi:iron(III) transport system substrate-binding protein